MQFLLAYLAVGIQPEVTHLLACNLLDKGEVFVRRRLTTDTD
ncbi:MAG TPA: hypothetical protein V6C93_37535 [Allocoleopsis sp.]